MHEKDLRRMALESGKTTSRKAKAKALSSRSSQAGSTAASPAVSPSHSPGGSRSGSRAVSRVGSEEDSSENDTDDELDSSIGSLALEGYSVYAKAPAHVWQTELSNVTDQIIENARTRKSNTEAREEVLNVYTNILRAQYASDELQGHLADLIPALLKYLKSGTSENEVVLALKALAITSLTTGEELFTEVQDPLRLVIQSSSSPKVQELAIHVLGTCAFFGGADMQDVEDVMDLYLDIIETNGESLGAAMSYDLVAAAAQEWGFLATMFEDLEGKTDRAIECFHDRLDSHESNVQCAVAEDIALLYEQSWTQLEDEETEDFLGAGELDPGERGAFQRRKWKRRYAVSHDNSTEYSIKSKFADNARSTSRHLSKDKRKQLHLVSRDVMQTIDRPYRGPRYSTALTKDEEYHMGHRLWIKVRGGASQGRDASPGRSSSDMVIDRWWKYHRFEAIRRVAGSGYGVHFLNNPVVKGAVPSGLDAPVEF